MNKTPKTASPSALPPKMTQAEPGSPSAPTVGSGDKNSLNGLLGALPDAPATVSVCAWCDSDKSLSKYLTAIGYKVSHGICEKCAETAFPKPQFIVGTEWKCRGVIPRIASGGRAVCWEGKLEYDITEPLTVQRCFKDYVISASEKKPVRVRTILLPLTLKK